MPTPNDLRRFAVMGPISPSELNATVKKIYTAAPTALCGALKNCSNPAEWFVDFHGCHSAIACDYHKCAWVREVRDSIGVHGEAVCPDCGMGFAVDEVSRMISWRVI